MTIFRFSRVIWLLLTGCADEPLVEPQDQSPPTYEVQIFRDDKAVDPASLLQDRAANPNQVVAANEGRKWVINGKILAIRKFDPVLDGIGGFGIPLKVSRNSDFPAWMTEDGIERSLPVEEVVVNMMGYNLQKAAGLKVGQGMRVSCGGLRSFNGTLIFDDCRERTGKNR